ncbi:unnamed protein product [Prunus armeniaca]|uniref:Uncharacterized protein n=1 Tax=Prunus armeniaca TaxID=36596 RepID=A0A6J5VM90_PRUAR|nr:unnamed protein product [Prunus armeniaca]CAB4317441.1 unnamed protein product [Prunus armeniaca]
MRQAAKGKFGERPNWDGSDVGSLPNPASPTGCWDEKLEQPTRKLVTFCSEVSNNKLPAMYPIEIP